MSYTLVWGSELLTFDKTSEKVVTIDNGALVERDGAILDVGVKEELKRAHPDAEELGSAKCMVLPGFVNSHYHGKGLTNFQLGTLDEGLELWILQLSKQPQVDPYLDTLYAAIKQVETGVTTAVHSHYRRDHSGYRKELLDSSKAYLESGLRVALSIGIKDSNTYVYMDNNKFIKSLPGDLKNELKNNLDKLGEIPQEEYFSIVSEFHESYNDRDERFKVLLGPVGPQWCTDDLLGKIGETARKLETGLHFHILESPYQKEYYRKRYGKSLVAHIKELGLLGHRVSCAHAVWVDEEDIELLARTGTTIAHNPSSNLRLKSGIMPMSSLYSRGVNVCLGTDGMTFNDDEDFIQEMRVCHMLHRQPGLESFSLSAADVFRMATVNGARAALMEDRIGTLEAGKAADGILVRKDRMMESCMEEEVSPLEALIYRGKGTDVETVMVGGRVLMKDRKITFADRDEVVRSLIKGLRRGTRGNPPDNHLLIEHLRPYILDFYRDWQV